MKLAVPKETYPSERRVALVPANIPHLQKQGIEVQVQAGAGESAGYPDSEYSERGAQIVDGLRVLLLGFCQELVALAVAARAGGLRFLFPGFLLVLDRGAAIQICHAIDEPLRPRSLACSTLRRC